MFSALTPENEKTSLVPVALSDALSVAGRGHTLCLVTDMRGQSSDQAARRFAAEGWRVTLLDLSPFPLKDAERPYAYVALAGCFAERNWYVPMQALCAYHWLKAHAFDLILFQNGFGAGYFCCQARDRGLAFGTTSLAVMAEDAHAFRLERAQHFPTFDSFRTDAEIDYFERETVSKADAVVVTSAALIDWFNRAGWLAGREAFSVATIDPSGTQPLGDWLAHFQKTPPLLAGGGQGVGALGEMPAISLCIVAEGNARYLDELLDSLRAQTAAPFDVMVMQGQNAGADVDQLSQQTSADFSTRGWSWIKRDLTDKAQLSNQAARLAKGDYIQFLDSDDVCLPDMVALLQASLRHKTADIIGAVSGKHANCDNTIAALAQFPSRTDSSAVVPVGWIYYGANLATCLGVNVIGNGCSLFRKTVFTKLGGFKPGVPAAEYGQSLLLKAALNGCRIEVLPEILTLTRRDKQGRILWSPERFEQDAAIVALLAATLPPHMRAAVLPFRSFNNTGKTLPRFAASSRQSIEKPPAPALLAKAGPMHVALCADDHYLEQACVTIASLLSAAQGQIKIHLITAMDAAHQAKAKAVAAHFANDLMIVPAAQRHDARIPASTMWNKGSNATYWRLGLPDCLPELDKVLYLDCDLIVRHDLADFWAIDLGANLLAAARDPIGAEVPKLAQDCGGDYFNAGVLLINLAQWRKEDLGAKALALAATFAAQNYPYQFHDQTPLNKATDGRWIAVSPTWNFNDDIGRCPGHFHLDQQDLASIGQDPAIYHFRTNKKPWLHDYPQNSIYGREYKVYQKMVQGLLRKNGHTDE
jgi:lipopolysaccharide biosynthesis glycosyltransferase